MALLFALPSPLRADEDKALPIPRFVSFKSAEVNVRTGPGVRYPIKWTYLKKNLPVEVVDEFDNWRKVKDHLGEEGWVHQTMLSGKRMAIITGAEPAAVLHRPEQDASPAFRAAPDVMGEIISCKPDWCYLSIDGLKGWLPKDAFYGVYKDEEIE